MPQNNLIERLKFLTLLLFISGSFNVLLLAFLFHYAFKERPPTPYCELMPVAKKAAEVQSNPSLEQTIRHFKTLKFEELIELLSSNKFVEQNVQERDLALATLTNFHDFDLKKALASLPVAFKQKVLMGHCERLLTYQGLEDKHFLAIIDYAKKERWPFKAKGLFTLLKNSSVSKDPTLAESFFLTKEFLAVKTLFSRGSLNVDNKDLLALLLEGEWALLSAFCERQKKECDLSGEQRSHFLLDYLKLGSKSAANLLLRSDFEFALNRLSDDQIYTLLQLLDSKTDETKQFVVLIISSPRGEKVRQMAEKRLSEYVGKMPSIQEKVLTNLKPKEMNLPIKKYKFEKKESTYTIQEGDSLWKIAKKFHLNVDTIRCYNRLASDLLKPGDVLKIPG